MLPVQQSLRDSEEGAVPMQGLSLKEAQGRVTWGGSVTVTVGTAVCAGRGASVPERSRGCSHSKAEPAPSTSEHLDALSDPETATRNLDNLNRLPD